jgi:hypothetical protein
MPAADEKPVTTTKIPGTVVPDVQKVESVDARARRWMSYVAVSTAVMAAMAAICSSLAGGHLNEAMIEQIRASDQWAYYQAKGVKATIVESRIDAAASAGQPPAPGDAERLARYKSEQEQISTEAKARQADADRHRRQYKTLARGATALQIGIGVAAVALLLRKNVYWALALVAGAAGAFFMVQGLLAL